MRQWVLAFAAILLGIPAWADAGTMLRVEYSNPGLIPSKWTLSFDAEGNGHFHSEPSEIAPGTLKTIEPVAVDKDVRVTPEFASRAFETARHHKLFKDGCESHLKVAFQGWKKLTYTGPEGSGGCEFNYSKSKDIQELGDSLVATASTIIEGARLELLLQHDPLGLDKEMEYISDATNDGRMQQICAIRGILQKLEDNPDIMERVRRRARALLAEPAK